MSAVAMTVRVDAPSLALAASVLSSLAGDLGYLARVRDQKFASEIQTLDGARFSVQKRGAVLHLTIKNGIAP